MSAVRSMLLKTTFSSKFESHSLRQAIENKLVNLIIEVHLYPTLRLGFVFGMSDMHFGTARENPVKAENY